MVASALSLVRDSIASATAVLVLVTLVVLAGATGIRAAGLACALSSALSFDFFLTEPYQSLTITQGNDVEAAILLMVIGGVVTETALWGQRQEAALGRQSGYLEGVLATADTVARRDQNPLDAARTVAQRIAEVLALDSCTFEPDGVVEPRDPVLQHDGTVVREGREIEVEREGLPVDSIVVLPVYSGGELRGRFLLTAATRISRPTLEQRRVAALLADQVAGSLKEGGISG